VTLPAQEEQAPARQEYGKSMPASYERAGNNNNKYVRVSVSVLVDERTNERGFGRAQRIGRGSQGFSSRAPIERPIDRSDIPSIRPSSNARARANQSINQSI